MSKVVVALILTAAAALAGASAGLALKPAAKPQQSQQTIGQAPGSLVFVGGVVPTGPGVPPALAGIRWAGAGGDLCWGGKNGNTFITVVPGQSIFPAMPPGSELAYVYDPACNMVFYTVCKFG